MANNANYGFFNLYYFIIFKIALIHLIVLLSKTNQMNEIASK